MSIDRIMNIAGSGMNAQLVRMNTTASNLANASVLAPSEEQAFRGKRAVFQTILENTVNSNATEGVGGVRVTQISDDIRPLRQMYNPGHPKASAEGYVWGSNVNEVEEMVDMMDASRSYQNNVEVVKTVKELMLRTLEISKA
jgi:flagellar basal-body rod protein FlgC